jgi:hypothetical protein
MNNIIRALVALALILSVGSCKKLLDVNINTGLQKTMAVHVDKTNGSAKDFSSSTVFNLDTDDLEDYQDLIKQVEIKSFSFEIINFSGDPNGSIEGNLFADGILVYEDDFIVKSVADAGTIFTIENIDELNSIAESLKDGKDITIIYNGTALSENGDMDFDVDILMELKVTANPL